MSTNQNPFHAFSPSELQVIDEMNRRQDVEFLSAGSNDLFACLDLKKVDIRSLILIHHDNGGSTSCLGKLADKEIKFPLGRNENKLGTQFLRVFAKRKKKNNITLLVNDDGLCAKYSNKYKSKTNREFFAAFLEDDHFAQLIWFDMKSTRRVHEIIVTENVAKENVRALAISFISRLTPEIAWEDILDDPSPKDKDDENAEK